MFVINCFFMFDFVFMCLGCIDCKIEFFLFDFEGCVNIFCIYVKSMFVECDIRWEFILYLCFNVIGVELCSVCIEVGMFVICVRRKVVFEKDFFSVVDKVIKGNFKFNFMVMYMQYNQRIEIFFVKG